VSDGWEAFGGSKFVEIAKRRLAAELGGVGGD